MSAKSSVGPNDILQALLDKHGELMHGPALWRALGFRSERSFQRAVQCSQIDVALFTLPGRRGRYAKTREVAGWLEGLGRSA
jgi:hypothetical protein